ncbi:MAG: O-antigen ligase family protein [Bacilli bacterium]|nr:O-antigen ligase family protein [Bacilli bacterium]MDD4733538.1 O-antigen ligase family protein [Bacilli bacterium]
MNNVIQKIKIDNSSSQKKQKNITPRGKKNKFNQIIYIVMLILFFLNWSTPSIHIKIREILPVFTALLLLFLVLININEIYKDNKQLFIFIFIIILTLIGMVVNNSNLGVFFVIFNFSLMLLVSSKVEFTDRFIIILSCLFLLFFFYWITLCPEGFNTNSIGLVTLVTYICSLYFIFSIKESFFKKILILLITFIAYKNVLVSESRSCFIGLISFTFLCYIIPKKMWLNNKSLKFIYLLITIGSIYFVMLYIFMWENNITFIIEGFSKNFFSGREAIWYELWNLFKLNPIFGLGSNIDLTSNSNLNVHNSMYNLLVIYGLLIFILIIIQICKHFSNISLDKNKNKFILISFAGFISIAVQSFFENTLISVNFIPIILFLLTTANSNILKKELKKN